MNNKDKAKRLRQIQSAFEDVLPFLRGTIFTKDLKEWTEESRAVVNIAINLAVDNKALIYEMADKYELGLGNTKNDVLNALNTHSSKKRDGTKDELCQYNWQVYFGRHSADGFSNCDE